MSLRGLPLALTSIGEQVEVTAIGGGRAFRKRLEDLGVLTGRTLEVVNKQGCGRMVIAVGDARFGLGQGMAQKILVAPKNNKEDAQNGCEAQGPCRRRPCRRGWLR